ncbi:MAG: hypothetical protein P8Y42_22335 [Exilibacterium sp.]
MELQIKMIIEDVTITRGKNIKLAILFKGGATETITLPPPQPAWMIRKTEKAIIKRIDQLLDKYTPAEIADILNREGKVTGSGIPFSRGLIHHIRTAYHLKSRRERMKEQGYLTASELARILGVVPTAVSGWASLGALPYTKDGKERLYKIPDMSLIDNLKKHLKPGRKNSSLEKLAQRLKEVQYEV